MDPNNGVHNFCANMFSLTGQHIEQLQETLASIAHRSTENPDAIGGSDWTGFSGSTLTFVLLAFLFLLYYKGFNKTPAIEAPSTGKGGGLEDHRRPNGDDEGTAT